MLDKLFSLFLCFPISVVVFFSTFVFLFALNITEVSCLEIPTVFRRKKKREKRNDENFTPDFSSSPHPDIALTPGNNRGILSLQHQARGWGRNTASTRGTGYLFSLSV